MNPQMKRVGEIRQILAADLRCGEVTPDNDQIWELTTTRGEPPAVALQTTYGMRALGMRVFPRFLQNKIPISDPRAFFSRPLVEFSAPSLVSLNYKPISAIDINQKVSVPNSQTLVGQITLTNATEKTVTLGMEWVVQLNSLVSGSPMSPVQISVNTVLQGQSQHLFPVFFLTGGPQANISAYPSLGIDLVFAPHTTRQFTWALATLESIEASFFNARKYCSYSLVNEHVKLQMLQKHQTIAFEFEGTNWGDLLHQSQIKTFQVLLPPFYDFNHSSYTINRLPDQGFIQNVNGIDSGSVWGIQNTQELWELNHLLLPARPDLVKEMLQNFLDQQAGDGAIDAKISWKKSPVGLLAVPLVSSLVLALNPYLNDKEWLSQVYPALVRSIQVWFKPEHDIDEDGFPEWQYLSQTGIMEAVGFAPEIRNKLEILVRAAEWPSLAALLWHECQCLIKIAKWLDDDTDMEWLQTRAKRLHDLVEECWNEKKGSYSFRDKTTHSSDKGKVLHTFRQNGSVILDLPQSIPRRIYVQVTTKDECIRPIECQLKAVCEKHGIDIFLTGKAFRWNDGCGTAVSEEVLSDIKQITITGLKKGDQAIVGFPDFSFKDPSFMIPLWTGILTTEQAEKTVSQGSEYLKKTGLGLPLFLKIMWIEGLGKYGFRELAVKFYQEWFLDVLKGERNNEYDVMTLQKDLSNAPLDELLPLTPLLRLLGIQKFTEYELIHNDFNEFFPKVNVQYKQVMVTLDTAKIKVFNLNGETITLHDPGPHRIVLS